jgi:branched-chain amino acid transport system ATP-binding protein
MLELENVASGYGKKQILFEVSLRAATGEIVAIIGPNGSGKSTLLKSIFGLVYVWGGRVSFGGCDITNRAPEENARRGVGYVPQGNRVFQDLTVRENLEVGGYTLPRRGVLPGRLERVLALFPALSERLRLRADRLSAGEKQMLALARALVVEPPLLLLDEPSLGLAPRVAATALDTLKSVARDLATTIVLVEQNVREALAVSHRVYGMKLGRIVLAEPAQSLLDDTRLRELFL